MLLHRAHRRRGRQALVVLTAVLPLAAIPVDAAASPESAAATAGRTTAALAPGADVAVSRRQDTLDLARGRLDAATAAEKADGFGSYEYDLDRGTLLVRWRGTVPKGVAHAGTAASASGVTVTFLPARYTAAQLLSEQQRLAGLSAAGKLPVQVTMIGPRSDAGGLKVGVPPGTAARMAPNAIVSSVALTYVDSAPVVPAWSRWDDSEPFWAAAGSRTRPTSASARRRSR